MILSSLLAAVGLYAFSSYLGCTAYINTCNEPYCPLSIPYISLKLMKAHFCTDSMSHTKAATSLDKVGMHAVYFALLTLGVAALFYLGNLKLPNVALGCFNNVSCTLFCCKLRRKSTKHGAKRKIAILRSLRGRRPVPQAEAPQLNLTLHRGSQAQRDINSPVNIPYSSTSESDAST